jgi:hypothetical protein
MLYLSREISQAERSRDPDPEVKRADRAEMSAAHLSTIGSLHFRISDRGKTLLKIAICMLE